MTPWAGGEPGGRRKLRGGVEENVMDELFKTAARFSWATALFGARQLGSAVSRRETDGAARSFDSVTRATEEQLSGVMKEAFRAGDRLQRGFWDLTFGVISLEAFNCRGMMRTTFNVMRQSAGALGHLMPGTENRAALQEFRSKLQVFDLFENVDAELRLPSGPDLALGELVGRAVGMDPFLAVWATEGIGHYYAENVWETRGVPDRLLSGVPERGVPAKSLAALHAGMGLSLANRLLGTNRGSCPDCAPNCELQGVLRQFVGLCRANSAEGYAGATYEALGLVARNLYPHLMPCIDRHLLEMGDNLAEYFWHGVGRAIYFAPTNYLPLGSASRRAVEMSQQEPPHELGRRNALSGVAWAMFLVNLRHPEVVENFLKQCDDGTFDGDAFANGVSSAAVIWRDSTQGDDARLDALCRHRPDPTRAGLAGRWRALVRAPCLSALDEYYETLKRHDRVGDVFRYCSLPELVWGLKGASYHKRSGA